MLGRSPRLRRPAGQLAVSVFWPLREVSPLRGSFSSWSRISDDFSWLFVSAMTLMSFTLFWCLSSTGLAFASCLLALSGCMML